MKSIKSKLNKLLTTITTLMLTGFFYCERVSANGLSNAVNSLEAGAKTNMLGDTKTKILGLSTEITDIAIIIVMTMVIISGIFTGIKFKNAADNPSEKAKLKGALTLEILAVVFLASYFGFVKFGFKTLKIFN